MPTIKSIKEKYIGSLVKTANVIITKSRVINYKDKKYVVLCSDYKTEGRPYGVCVEMIVGVEDGLNHVRGSRPADNMTDALDVACEMLYEDYVKV